MDKRGLCSFDDKRYLLEDGVSTLAFGNRRIPVRVVHVPNDTNADGLVLRAEDAPHVLGRWLRGLRSKRPRPWDLPETQNAERARQQNADDAVMQAATANIVDENRPLSPKRIRISKAPCLKDLTNSPSKYVFF